MSDDPLDRALFGRRGGLTRRALTLSGGLFVATAAGFGVVEQLHDFETLAHPLLWQLGTVAVLALSAAHAYLNEGLVVCWALVFGPAFGAAVGLGGAVFAAGESGLLQTITASAIGAGTVAVLFGGVGFLVGYVGRHLTS